MLAPEPLLPENNSFEDQNVTECCKDINCLVLINFR